MHSRRIVLLLCIIFSASVQKACSQITLDTVYSNASVKLFMVNLEVSGVKYVVKSMTPGDRFLKFYNLDHSFWKFIDCDSFPAMVDCVPPYNVLYVYHALYISETLFDCDSELEFMYFSYGSCKWYTGIYKEDGSCIFAGDSLSPLVQGSVPQQWRPIYNTPDGTKLILSHKNGSGVVYDLPCTLSTDIDQLIDENNQLGDLQVFPNPSYYESSIAYTLPAGINKAQIMIYDGAGNVVKTYTVDRSFSNLLISTSELSAGTYVYSLTTDKGILVSKKVIVLSK